MKIKTFTYSNPVAEVGATIMPSTLKKESFSLPPFGESKLGGRESSEYQDGEQVTITLTDFTGSRPMITAVHEVGKERIARYAFTVTDEELQKCTYSGEDIPIDIEICLEQFGYTVTNGSETPELLVAKQYIGIVETTVNDMGEIHSGDPVYDGMMERATNAINRVNRHYTLYSKIGEEAYMDVVEKVRDHIAKKAGFSQDVGLFKTEDEIEGQGETMSMSLDSDKVFLLFTAVAQVEGHLPHKPLSEEQIAAVLEGGEQ